MKKEFKNKTIFITGAANGQGRACAIGFAKEGANIIAVNRGDISKLYSLKEEIESLGANIEIFSVDVTNEIQIKNAIKRVIKKFEKIDILFNNAGVCHYGKSYELTQEQWDYTIDINLKGTWLVSKYVIPHLIKEKSGVIINNSSIAGIKGMENLSHYSASKFGVVGLTQAQAVELAEFNIRVVSIHPAGVNTPMKIKMAEEAKTTMDVISKSKVNLLNTPWLESEDIVNAVLFLASDKARYITGIQFVLDAGRMIKPI